MTNRRNFLKTITSTLAIAATALPIKALSAPNPVITSYGVDPKDVTNAEIKRMSRRSGKPVYDLETCIHYLRYPRCCPELTNGKAMKLIIVEYYETIKENPKYLKDLLTALWIGCHEGHEQWALCTFRKQIKNQQLEHAIRYSSKDSADIAHGILLQRMNTLDMGKTNRAYQCRHAFNNLASINNYRPNYDWFEFFEKEDETEIEYNLTYQCWAQTQTGLPRSDEKYD